VTAAPAIFTVAPKGIDTLAVDGLTPKRSAKSKLTGMFAATLGIHVDLATMVILSVVATVSACGASGVAGGSLLQNNHCG
jgi:hypothetical protein